MDIDFFKMHGCGNDFVVIDHRQHNHNFSADLVKIMADRRKAIGFDQLLVIKKPTTGGATAKITIFNPDGKLALACGNGTRCVVGLLAQQLQQEQITIETDSGIIKATLMPNQQVCLNMGRPKFNYDGKEQEINRQNLGIAGFDDGFLVNVGNPHIIFFRDYIDLLDISKIGPQIEHHQAFSDRINVSFAEIIDRENIKLRVWERGTGETLACGTAACASFAAANHQQIVGEKAKIHLPGGNLLISLLADGSLTLIGDYNFSFTGKFSL